MRPSHLPIITVGLVLLISSVWIIFSHPTPKQLNNPISFPTSTVTIDPSSTPTLIPTITPSASPTPTLKPTSTPRPTPIATATPKPISGPPGSGLSTVTVATPYGNFKATVVSLENSNTRMVTDTAQDNDCASDCQTLPLKDYLNRHGGFAGVNGTYFCVAAYPECASKKDSFDFPVYNSRLSKWMQADKLGWSNRRAIVYQDGGGFHYQHNSSGFSSGLNAGIINYPGLVDGSTVQIDEAQSGLSDKQKSKGTKIGLAVRNSSTIMIVAAYNVNMLEFAHVMKGLGATGGLNLDSGGSSAIYYNGSFIAGPGRNLPNAVIFSRK